MTVSAELLTEAATLAGPAESRCLVGLGSNRRRSNSEMACRSAKSGVGGDRTRARFGTDFLGNRPKVLSLLKVSLAVMVTLARVSAGKRPRDDRPSDKVWSDGNLVNVFEIS